MKERKTKRKTEGQKDREIVCNSSQLLMGDCKCVSLGQRVNRLRNEGNSEHALC
jgi:hypothetical protein